MNYPERPTDKHAPLLHWRDGSVAHIRFNRPQALNAIDVPMTQAFLNACGEIAGDSQVRAVLLSGEGRAFMAGGDLAAMQQDPQPVARALIAGMHGGIHLLASLSAPVVASVHGAVAGAGLGLVLGCDLVVAAEDTRFAVAYPLVGASADCGTSWALPRLVGLHKAMELALLSETFDAAEALRLGLVNRVAPAATLADVAGELVQRLAKGPTHAYGRLKSLLRSSLNNGLDTQLAAEAAAFDACAGTGDFREGVAAFLEKRRPVFGGR